MKEWISKYQKAIIGTGSIAVLLICFLQQRELTKLRTEVKLVRAEVDSIRSEDFVKSTIIGRYELTMEHLNKVNPKVARQTERWMSNNTE